MPGIAIGQGMFTRPRVDPNKVPVYQTADPVTRSKVGQCLAVLPGAAGFRNYCDERVAFAYCVIAPVHPFTHPTPQTEVGHPTCGAWGKGQTVYASLDPAGSRNPDGAELDTDIPNKDLSGRSIEWMECRGKDFFMSDGTTYILGKGWRGHCENFQTGEARPGVTGSRPGTK